MWWTTDYEEQLEREETILVLAAMAQGIMMVKPEPRHVKRALEMMGEDQ